VSQLKAILNARSCSGRAHGPCAIQPPLAVVPSGIETPDHALPNDLDSSSTNEFDPRWERRYLGPVFFAGEFFQAGFVILRRA
jgi:hypothetical protein